MLVPTREAKCYGAIHIDNYIEFTGFCKKVDSNDPQTVDIYLDGKKIESLLANQNIEKISRIYDINNHAFKFILNDNYFDKSYLLEFKVGNDSLVNSPIKTIERFQEEYNIHKFKFSISNLEHNDLNVSLGDKIGFLGIDENLNDEQYIALLKDLAINYNNEKFCMFYFDSNQKQKAQEIFQEYANISFEIISDIKEMIKNLKIYICNVFVKKENYNLELELANTFYKYKNNILLLGTGLDWFYKSVKDLETTFEHSMKNYMTLLSEKNIKIESNSFYISLYSHLLKNINTQSSINLETKVGEIFLTLPLKYALSNEKFFIDYRDLIYFVYKT